MRSEPFGPTPDAERDEMGYAHALSLAHPDTALVERCRLNDEAAFNEVVARYKNKVYNYICRMLNNSDDAEDLTQEVFVRMYTSIDSFRSHSSLNTWLFRIASNLCIDYHRRGKKFRAHAFSLDAPVGGDGGSEPDAPAHEVADISYEPHRLLEHQEMTQQLQRALGQLPEKLRAVILLHDIEDMPYEEIAQVIGCPLGTVKSRLFNARVQLRQRMSAYLDNG